MSWYRELPLAYLYRRFPDVTGRCKHGPAHDVLRYLTTCERLGAVLEERFASPMRSRNAVSNFTPTDRGATSSSRVAARH